MIGSVRGKVILKDGNYLIVETGGVGYRVLVSSKVFLSIKLDQNILVYTYTHVKEDELSLFGFLDLADLKLFENLIRVSGIGPKTGMSIFSFLTREEVVNAVLNGDTKAFMGIPRLGTKNAQKLIIELKNKLGGVGSIDLNGLDSSGNEDVFVALEGFGFSRKEIQNALKNIDSKTKTQEDMIKFALKFLGK